MRVIVRIRRPSTRNTHRCRRSLLISFYQREIFQSYGSLFARGGVVTTPPIPPEQWFPLIRAAWTYVHTFAPDILQAQERYEQLVDNATKIPGGHVARLDRYLADPANPIPVHTAANQEHGGVHWSLLAMMLGSENSSRSGVFRRDLAAGRRRIARVEQALASGHPTTTGVIDGLAVVQHADGTSAPWHPGLDPRALGLERRMLRNACYVLVVALSMMRGPEKRAELHLMQHSAIRTTS